MQYDALTLNWFGGEAAADGSEAAADGTPTEATEETAENSAEKDAPSGAERSDADDAAQREEPPEMTEAEQRDIMRKAAAIARFNAAQAVVQRWEEEAEDLKHTYPAFSLEQSLRSDKGFASLLRAGVPVKLAYEAANLEKIVGAAMRYAAETAGKRTVQSIRAGTGRVRENPVLDRAASVLKKDVNALSEKDILRILRQVGNGERVTF